MAHGRIREDFAADLSSHLPSEDPKQLIQDHVYFLSKNSVLLDVCSKILIVHFL